MMTTVEVDLGRRLRTVPAPRPVMDRGREERLTDRQREVLERLGDLFDDGFVHLTMADIAGRVGCSLRTLYDLAPSRDELVLTVVDRNLRRIGRSAVCLFVRLSVFQLYQNWVQGSFCFFA